MDKIPCFVISYNRPTFLKKCVEELSKEERLDIHIIHNDKNVEGIMTDGIPYGLNIWMDENYGHKVCWSQNLIPIDRPYIVTDCDIVVPSKLNWLDVLLAGMKKFPNYNKFGLGLSTRHIPSINPQKDEIIRHETKNIYRKLIGDAHFIEMPVDTTLALYRTGYNKYSIWGNDSPIEYTGECKAVRTMYPYEAIHLTWQMTPEEIAGEEHQNYLRSIKPEFSHWNK